MANKITNKQRYEALIELVKANGISLSNGEVSEGTNEMVAFLESRIEGLEKKVSKGNEKADKEQAEVDEKVLFVMTKNKVKVSEVVISVNGEYGTNYTSSRITASLRRLMAKGVVGNVVEKKNSYYFLIG
jgi:hypothetical protein